MFLNPFFYGVAEISFDTAALANGVVTLTSCSGILPDGTVFSVPREDDMPGSRSFVEHFTHEQQECKVFLGLPLAVEGRPGVATDPEASDGIFRYRSREATVVDEAGGALTKQIEVGLNNFSLLFGGENSDNYTTVQIALLRRDPNGRVEFQENFIPPLAQIGGSPYLLRELRSLLEMLLAKSGFLAQGRRESAGGKATFLRFGSDGVQAARNDQYLHAGHQPLPF